ncbi:calcineurin-like phosphoesterase C-terminal domain-containing protein [Algoriphagus vanfongensis]|uniref:calcineurin-like phosphoesterase C-terminal domain-containing protein n=1 Tax=Algoriphagus vanfongensis TaxID=426371 RepID=UPI00047D7E08|nr:calcineurin-like phosphoesterase family protein [Algoriphagus vanfongensis]
MFFEINNKRSVVILLLLFIWQLSHLTHAQTPSTVSGYVFEDLNKNGKRDSDEIGLVDIGVTNGVQVVLTDREGKYTLPASEDMIVSVIKPSGFSLSLNEKNQPEFYYIHKPNGSPETGEKGVAPTGDLPSAVNFPLYRTDESDSFSVLLFGDPQADDLTNAGYFEKAIVDELIGGNGAVFGLSLGDLGARDLYPVYISNTAKIGIPWYNLLGNHDMNKGDRDELTDETYEASFGPASYSLNYGNAHFIILDDVVTPDPYGRSSYVGGFREDILAFVENDLKYVPKDKLVVLAFHIPIYEFEVGPDQFREGDREKLFALLEGYHYTLSLSGHTHSENHHFFTPEEGWPNEGFHHHYNPGATSGSIYVGPKDSYGTPSSIMRDGTPKGYAFLTIKGNQYSYEYVPSGDNDWKMSVHIPKIVPQVKKYRGEISVNFFQGSPRDILEFRIDGGEWQLLEFKPDYDKFLLDLHYEWDHADTLPWGIRPSTPLISSHIWSTRMPSDLPLGMHELEIRATDWLGRNYSTRKTFEVVPDHLQ